MKSAKKKAGLFLISLAIITLSAIYFIAHYNFPKPNNQAAIDQLLLWVAVRVSTGSPYKYWYPLAFLIVPGGTWLLWQGLCRFFKIKLKPKAFLKIKKEPIRKFGPLELLLITALITYLIFNYSYSSFYQFFFNYHHLNYITGPLNDVLNGKLMLINTKTQYGFLNIVLTSFIFKLGFWFSHANVHFLSMILGVIEYLCIYAIIRLLTSSRLWAVFGIVLTTAVHFYGAFSIFFPSEIYVWPGSSVWRFFPTMPAILLILLWLKKQDRRYLYASQAVTAIGFFWNLEAGIPFVLGQVALLLVNFYNSRGNLKTKLKPLALNLLRLLLMLLAIMALYSGYTWLLVKQLPDWRQLYYYLVLFSKSGFLQYAGRTSLNNPANLILAWLPILAYSFIILSAINRRYFKRGLPINDLSFLSLVAVFGFGIYRYYLSKQIVSNLAAVSIPAAIIAVYLAHQYSYLVFSLVFYRSKFYVKKTTMILVINYFLVLVFLILPLNYFLKWQKKLAHHRQQDLKQVQQAAHFNYPPKNRLPQHEGSLA